MSSIIKYVKTRDGKVYPVIKEATYSDGLCYVMPNGYAIDSEEVIKSGKTIEEVR